MKGEELTFVMAMDAFIDFFQAKSLQEKGWGETTTARELKVPELKVYSLSFIVGIYENYFSPSLPAETASAVMARTMQPSDSSFLTVENPVKHTTLCLRVYPFSRLVPFNGCPFLGSPLFHQQWHWGQLIWLTENVLI